MCFNPGAQLAGAMKLAIFTRNFTGHTQKGVFFCCCAKFGFHCDHFCKKTLSRFKIFFSY